jgi:hypothetical protein
VQPELVTPNNIIADSDTQHWQFVGRRIWPEAGVGASAGAGAVQVSRRTLLAAALPVRRCGARRRQRWSLWLQQGQAS